MENQTTALEDLEKWVKEFSTSLGGDAKGNIIFEDILLDKIKGLYHRNRFQIQNAFHEGIKQGRQETVSPENIKYKSARDFYLKTYPKGL